MQTKKVKCLDINKLNEYPTISLEEQLTIKGGGVPWIEILKYALQFGVPAAVALYETFSDDDEEKKKVYGIDANQFLIKIGEAANNNNISIDSLKIDSITPAGIYGFKLYGKGSAQPY